MLNKDWERDVKNNLEAAKISWDKEALWKEIEPQLPSDSKRRVFILLSSILLLLVFSGVIVFSIFKKEKAEALQEDIVVNAAELMDESSKVELNEQPQTDQIALEQKNNIKVLEELINTKAKADPKATNGINENSIDHQIVRQGPFQKGPLAFDSEGIKDAELTDQKEREETNYPLSDRSQELDISNEIKTQNYGLADALVGIDKIFQEPLVLPLRELYNIPGFASVEQITPIKIKPLLFEVGFAFGIGHFENNIAGLNQELVRQRQDSETALEQLTGSIRFRILSHRGMYLETGLDYKRYNFKVQYLEDESRIETEVIDSAKLVNKPGAQEYRAGEVDVKYIKTTRHNRYNYLSSWIVPLHLGYQIALNRWAYNFSVGVGFNIKSNYNGGLIDEEGAYVSSIAFEKDRRSKLENLDFRGSISYRIKPQIKSFLEFNYSRGLANYNYDQSYSNLSNTIGLNFGIAYIIN